MSTTTPTPDPAAAEVERKAQRIRDWLAEVGLGNIVTRKFQPALAGQGATPIFLAYASAVACGVAGDPDRRWGVTLRAGVRDRGRQITAKARERHGLWQFLANACWASHPNWSLSNVARMLAKLPDIEGSARTIRRAIRKPTA